MRTLPLLSVALALVAGSSAAGSRATFLYTPPVDAPVGKPFTVEGNLSGGSFSRVVVKVRGPGESWEEYELTLQYGDLYRVTLPASRMVPPGIELYVEGVSDSGSATPLFATAARPARVIIVGDVPAADDDEKRPSAGDEPSTSRPKKKPRCKKGRKCKDEPREPEPKDAQFTTPEKPEQPGEPVTGWVDTSEPPPKSSPPERSAEETRPRPVEKAAPALERAEPPAPRQRTALDEELAVYGAEAPSGFVQRLDERTRKSVLAPVVLSAAQLKALGVRYVHEALDLVPGLSVSRDVQGFYRLAVRGLRSDAEVLFFLDGQRLNNVYDGKALWTLPVDNLARIEVVRGPASADTGLGDYLAVVKLFTFDQDGVRASFNGGSFDAFDGHVAGNHSWSAFRLSGDVDVASQYGYRRDYGRDGLDPVGATPRPKRTLDNRFLVNAGLRAGLETGAGAFGLSGRFMLENRSALMGLFDTIGNESRLGWQSIDAALTWSKPIGELGTVSARLFFGQQDTNRLWQLTYSGYQAKTANPDTLFPDGLREQVTVGARTIGLAGRAELDLPAKNKLVAGLDAQVQSISNYAYLANYVPGSNLNAGKLVRPDGLRYPTEDGKGGRGPAADRPSFGLFASDTWTPLDALSIEAGLRVDFMRLPSADSTGAWTGAGLVPSFGPRLGLAVTPFDALVLRAHYGRAWRAPTVQELAETIPNSDSNQGRAIGNPSLTGAYVDLVEAGTEYLQGLGDAKLRLRAGAFFEKLSNPVALIDTTGNLVPYTNRPLGVQSYGLEGEARLEVTPRAIAWVNSSWQRAQDLGTPATGRLLTDVPQVRLNAGFSLPLGRWLDVDVVLRYASERRNNSRSVLEQIRSYTLPAYTLVSAQLRTEPLFDHLELGVMGQNVFTVDYADDVPRPDRMPGGVPRESILVFGTARVIF